MCKEWGLNRDVESVIRWHHQPDIVERGTVGEDELNKLIDVVHVGNWMSFPTFGLAVIVRMESSLKRLWNDFIWMMIKLIFSKKKLVRILKSLENFLNLIERAVG